MNQPRSRLATLASTALAGLLRLPAASQFPTNGRSATPSGRRCFGSRRRGDRRAATGRYC
jgi:hypothetical protein